MSPMRALIVMTLLVVGCNSDAPGRGWWCHEWSYEGEPLGHCARTEAACKDTATFVDDGKTYVTSAELRGVKRSGFDIACRQQPQAACFTITERMSEKKIYACSADFRTCEHVRSLGGGAADY